MNSSDNLSKSCTFSSVNGQAESDTSRTTHPHGCNCYAHDSRNFIPQVK